MANDIQNQACPAAETKSGCSCKKKLAVAVIAVLIVAVAAVAAYFALCCGGALPKYAPEGTEVIAYGNGNKIVKTKVYAAFKKTLAYENAAKAAKKEGLDLDEIAHNESVVFVDVTEKGPNVCGIFRSRGGVAKKLFNLYVKEEKQSFADEKAAFEKISKTDPNAKAPTLSTRTIAGKAAMVKISADESKAVILRNKNNLQFSYSADKDALVTKLLKAKSTELSKMVDTGALISVVYKFELPKEYREMLNGEGMKTFADLVNELKIVAFDLCDAGNDLELKLVAEYGSEQAAKKSEESLIALRKLLKDNVEDKKIAAVIDEIKIKTAGKKVTVSLKYSQSKIVELIEEWDKSEREAEKNEREAEKKLQEESKKLEPAKKAEPAKK